MTERSTIKKIGGVTASLKDNVRCSILSHVSGQMFASGGEDGLIKTWNVGVENPVLEFDFGRPVSALHFGLQSDSNEETIIAGNIAGGIRLHDIQSNKIIRTFVGHRSEVTGLDSHPCECYIASGSSDCNVKVWDSRERSSIMTYKGHNSIVNCVCFSPDGRWLVSGDDSGVTKLWDLSAGKAIHEFHDQHSVNDILFHPEELVLATGSAGKVVRFWDLESWEHICRTQRVTTPVSKILFPDFEHLQSTNDDEMEEMTNNPTSRQCLVATRDSLRVWNWEPKPVTCLDTIEVLWNSVADMCQLPNHNDLICLENFQNRVIIWHVDLASVYFGDAIEQQQKKNAQKKQVISMAPQSDPSFPPTPAETFPSQPDTVETEKYTVAETIIVESPLKESTPEATIAAIPDSIEMDTKPETEPGTEPETGYTDEEFEVEEEDDIPVTSDDDTTVVAISKTKQDNTNTNNDISHSSEPTQIGSEKESDALDTQSTVPKWIKDLPKECLTQSFFETAKQVHNAKKMDTSQSNPKLNPKPKPKPAKKNPILSPPIKRKPIQSRHLVSSHKKNNRTTALSTPKTKQRRKQNPNITFGSPQSITSNEGSLKSTPIQFTKKPLKFGNSNQRHLVDYDDRELVKLKRTMMTQHRPILKLLSTRLRHLRTLKSLWRKKDLSKFVETLHSFQNSEPTLISDFLNCILKNFGQKRYSLRFCTAMLPMIQNVFLLSTADDTLMLGLNYVYEILQSFIDIIVEMKDFDLSTINGIDISAEERKQTCDDCCKKLLQIKPIIQSCAMNNNEGIKTKSTKCLEIMSRLG